jgi:uncharacterized repeat protein (TIGR01451 family)
MNRFSYILLMLLLRTGFQTLQAQEFDVFYSLNQHLSHFIKEDTIWVAAEGGVFKQQCSTGKLLASYTPNNTPFPYSKVTGVCVDHKNRLWLYLELYGIAMLDGSKWTVWPADAAYYVIAGGYGGQIATDDQNNVWIGAGYRGPMKLVDGSWQNVPIAVIGASDTRRLKTGPDGKMWMLDGSGRLLQDKNGALRLAIDDQSYVYDFAFAPDKSIYTVCSVPLDKFNNAYYVRHYAQNMTLLDSIAVKEGIAVKIALGKNNEIWIADNSGDVRQYTGNSWKSLNGRDHPREERYISNFSRDGNNRLWITKESYGTKFYDGSHWGRRWYGPIGHEFARGDPDGSIWLSYLQTLSKMNPQTGQTEYHYFDAASPFEWNTIDMQAGPNGTFYAMRQRGLVEWYDGKGNFKKFELKTNSLPFLWDAYVTSGVDRFGRLYFTTDMSFHKIVYRLDPVTGDVKSWTFGDGLPAGDSYTVCRDGQGRIWLAGYENILLFNGTIWKTVRTPPNYFGQKRGGSSTGIYSIFYYEGSLKIQFIDEKNYVFKSVPIKNGEEILNVFSDSKGWIWCMTNAARILCFSGYSWQIYDAEAGTAPFGARHAFEDAQGQIWFTGTPNSLIMRLNLPVARVNGQCVDDLDDDCIADASEPGAEGYRIVFDDGLYKINSIAGTDGKFSSNLPEGKYRVSVLPLTALGRVCRDSFVQTVVKGAELSVRIATQAKLKSPLMTVAVNTPFLRRCFEVAYYLGACNEGNLTADSARVSVQLPKTLAFLSSTTPHKADPSGRVDFYLGSVAPGDCRSIVMKVKVACEGVIGLGESICLSAFVFPDTFPMSGGGGTVWKGGSLRINGRCETDRVVFEAENTGRDDLRVPSKYEVAKDSALFEKGAFDLRAGEKRLFSYAADGSTWRFSADQEPGRPLSENPSVAVEGCIATGVTARASKGYVTQANNATGSPFEVLYCQETIGSFDPNDKAAQPKGWGQNRYIRPSEMLNYTIRFQNTGSDTAFTVVVRDTLDARLDWNTFRPGLSSHRYAVVRDSARRAVAFVFNNIYLPDSNRNEPASHGFVQFKIMCSPKTPLGTILRNRAAIYFDFNNPIFTNAVLHRVDTGFVRRTPIVKTPPPSLLLAPNPAKDKAVLTIAPFDAGEPLLLRIYYADGHLVREEPVNLSSHTIRRDQLPVGVYTCVLWSGKKWIGARLLVFGVE